MKNCPWKKAKEDECGHSFHLAIVSISITIFLIKASWLFFLNDRKFHYEKIKKKISFLTITHPIFKIKVCFHKFLCLKAGKLLACQYALSSQAAAGSRQPSVAEKKLSFQRKGSKEPTGHFVATANKILPAEPRRSLMSL